MPKVLNTPSKTEKPKNKLIVRLMLPMLLLVLLQLVTFFAILILGGEFSYLRQYAYSTLIERTQNRKTYVQNQFQQKIPFVQESSEKINNLIAEILEEQGATIAALQNDKVLNRIIMESSVESLEDLLRRSTVNDVYLILETGSLYSDVSNNAKPALYLRDLDATTDAGYEDLLMEIGFSSISQEYNIMLDSGWTLLFEPDPEDVGNYDFYYKTIQTAQENSTLPRENLGYWSGFSTTSRRTSPSMKYSVPLIAEDGTVYGILGIGLTENTVLANLPSNDFISERACYVLGRKSADNHYDIITHSGIEFEQFIGSSETLQISGMLNEDVYDIFSESGIDLAGCIQYINLYNQESPYFEEQWAVISVADRASVLRLLTNLIRMLFISALISLIVSIVVIIISSRQVVKPISNAIKTMVSNKEYSQVIRFEPSHIYEIDKMTDEITQLQINVQDFSSQISQMMRIADVGIGMFMYDRTDGSVFVGQSLLKDLQLQVQADGDVMTNIRSFLDSIIAKETRQAVTEALEMDPDEAKTDYVKVYSIEEEDGSPHWVRLSLVHNKNKSIGILQNVTRTMMEKKRIEYERDYDTTTGLLNRRAYYRRIGEVFGNKAALKITAFLMIDLDNLKYVNDTYGHDFGDDYIKTAATVLKKFENCGGIVARLSGDEFNVCLPGFSSKDEIREIINEVREQLLQSYCLLSDGTHYKIRASAGISWYPDDAESYEMLMKYADFAMYTIKHSTKGAIAEFDINAYKEDSVLLTGVEEMNRIIDERSVRYAFQNIISAKTGEIYGYEALMRPQSTIFRSPTELLRVAKTSAKLYEIEHLTWTMALEAFKAQIDAGRISEDCYLFINSISNCALDPADADALEDIYTKKMLSRVVLELLEGENAHQEYHVRKKARMNKWHGRIALDDFGSGYNNEYALVNIRPDIIKIDCSIIVGCDKDVSRRTVISNLVKLARTNNILVLAEGIETEGELETVISCGVDLLQGFYFDNPVFEPQPLAPEFTEKIRRFADPASKQEYAI